MSKAFWTATAATVAPIAAVAAMWPNFEPALDWFVRTSSLILERPTVQAVIVSMTLGVLLALFIPQIAPGKWQPSTTKAMTRVLCMAVTFASCLVLLRGQQEASITLVYATLSALASSAVWTTASGLLYRVTDKPESLK